MAMEIFGCAVLKRIVDNTVGRIAQVPEYLVASIGQEFWYVFCYNHNIEKMTSELEKLEAKRYEVQLLVDAANNDLQIIRSDVDAWLNSVDKKKEEVNLILAGTENVVKGCFDEWCLNLKSRYWLSRESAKRTEDLVQLLAEGNFQRVSYPPPALGKVPTTSTTDKSEVASNAASADSSKGIQSRLLVERDVMEALDDKKVWMIGITGMGGVGKTTFVDQVSKNTRDERMFDEIVKAVVSQKPDVKSIQRDIADLLQLELKEHNLEARAHKLRDRLTQRGPTGEPKRILIILDDLWKRLDLKQVGIPFGDDHNGCKILFTTRSIEVCLQMKVDRTFPIQLLSEDEALSLFKDSAGATNLYPAGVEIVKECGGLPIAITTIAMVLVGEKKEETWNYVLRQLKRSVFQGEYGVVYKTLEVSYDFLYSEELKRFFRLCCLFPEDFAIPIVELVRYGVGLKLFEKVYSLHEATENALAHVEKLKKQNLLLGSDGIGCVKLHDVVRDFGITIPSEGRFMVKFDDDLKEWPVEETRDDLTSISLECSKIDELPSGLKCPNLELLRLESSGRSLKFPESFYEGMSKLQVLSWGRMNTPQLPKSLQMLASLHTLSINQCLLGDDIPLIGNLETLEILSFAGSNIVRLPTEIGKLSRLRSLDLKNCDELRSIAPGVLSRLVRLEELYIRSTKFVWAGQEGKFYDTSNLEDIGSPTFYYVEDTSSFTELKRLSNLVVVDINIPNGSLPLDFLLEKLKRFKISPQNTNHTFEREFDYAFQNALDLKGNTIELKNMLNVLSGRTEYLALKVRDLELLPNMSKVRTLKLNRCYEMVYIFDMTGQDRPHIFRNIESLYLVYMNNMKDICHGQSFDTILSQPSSSRHQFAPFANLRNLRLRSCNRLKSVFSLSIARGLMGLETLIIESCLRMEQVFAVERKEADENASSKIIFPRLNYLHLHGLDNLTSLCNGMDEIELPQLQHLELNFIPKITSIYAEMETLASKSGNASQKHPLFNKVMLPSLANLTVKRMANLTTVFDLQGSNHDDGEHGHEAFPQLKTIHLSKLDKLKQVWMKAPPHTIEASRNLRSLEVRDCESFRHLFKPSTTNEITEEEEEATLFPRLTSLSLKYLPNLSIINPQGYTFNWSSLKELNVDMHKRHLLRRPNEVLE